MTNNYYEGFIPMNANIEKTEFTAEDDTFSYQVPNVYLECCGEICDSMSAFDWIDDSIFVVKDNRIVQYTERNASDILMTDMNGQKDWVPGHVADIMGMDVDGTEDKRSVKEYFIEEYDFNKCERRKYKVILEETSEFKEYEIPYPYFKERFLKESESGAARLTLREI